MSCVWTFCEHFGFPGHPVSGVVAVLHWLSFVPAVAGNDPATVLTADSVERDIAYVPEKGADPRLMLTGKTLPATTESPKV
jgi:hypothetical protein